MSFTNCEGYLTYDELITNWCWKINTNAICGIGDGIIFGKDYDCAFYHSEGYCWDIDGGHECTRFVREPTNLPTATPSIYPYTNCEGYLDYDELPLQWCEVIGSYTLCGIGNGIIRGSWYDCDFLFAHNGECHELGSDHASHACVQFAAIPTRVPTPKPTIWTSKPTIWTPKPTMWPTSNPSMMSNILYPTEASTTYRPVESHEYCDEYLTYDEIPSDWCENLTPWSRCGIADGLLFGSSNPECYFRHVGGWEYNCTDIDSNSECTQFLRESNDEHEDIESADFELTENLLIVFIIIQVLYLLGCCILCWKMSRRHKNDWNLAEPWGRQQQIEHGRVADSLGMSVLQHEGVEAALKIVEPKPGDAIVNSMPLRHLRSAAVEEQAREDSASPQSRTDINEFCIKDAV